MSEPHPPVVRLLRELVAIPSPNPPGDCRAVAERCTEFLRGAGFEVALLAPDGRAWSAVGTLAGVRAGPTLMYHAHIDTVPLGQSATWRHNPFGGAVDGGRVYGLGSVDDKGPMAAMLQAAADIAARRHEVAGRLVVVCAAEEEVGGRLGTRWLAESGHLPPCDFIVVGEQTHNRVATANKGVLRATVRVDGRTAHATSPARGRNAINGMARVILALESYERDTLARRVHPLLGAPSVNVGVIAGGVSANVVADRCAIQIDRRMVPGEAPEAAIAELRALVAACQRDDPERSYALEGLQVSDWFQTSAEHPLTRLLLQISAEETGAAAEPVGYLPGSDAKHLVGLARGAMVVLGPGTYEVAHVADEFVAVDELETTYRILRRFAEAALITGSAGA